MTRIYLNEAIAEYDRILRLNPNYPLAHYYLAQAYERKGEYDQARLNYDRFLMTRRTHLRTTKMGSHH